MLSSISPRLFIWLYILCVMVVMQTQLDIGRAANVHKSVGQKPKFYVYCSDVLSKCKTSKIQCKKNTWKQYCQKTCGVCIGNGKKPAAGSCYDVWSNCNIYKTYCKKNKSVKKYCKKTCGSCTANSRMGNGRSKAVSAKKPKSDISAKHAKASGSCKDIWPNCDIHKPWCTKRDYTKKYCRKTCRWCGAHMRMPKPKPTPKARKMPTLQDYKIARKRAYRIKKYIIVRTGMTSIPTNIPALTTRINFEYNSIRQIRAHELTHLKHLKDISFYNNWIGNISAQSFKGLSKLASIELTNNQISFIPAGIFAGLKNLRTLSMHGNKIRSFPPGTFDDLAYLELLGLQDNQIRSIPIGTFTPLLSLNFLNLRNNKLTSLSKNVFSKPTLAPPKPKKGGCKDLWTNCWDYETGCKAKGLAHVVKKYCRGTCGFCPGGVKIPPPQREGLLLLSLSGNFIVCNTTTRWLKTYVKLRRLSCDMNPCH